MFTSDSFWLAGASGRGAAWPRCNQPAPPRLPGGGSQRAPRDPASFSTSGPKKRFKILPACQVLEMPEWPETRSPSEIPWPLAAGGAPAPPQNASRRAAHLCPRWRSCQLTKHPRRVAGWVAAATALLPAGRSLVAESPRTRAPQPAEPPPLPGPSLFPVASGCSTSRGLARGAAGWGASPKHLGRGEHPALPPPLPGVRSPPCPESAGRSHVMYISREALGVNQCILGEGKFFYLVE